MYCGNCGKEIEDGVTFYPECGSKIESEYHQKAAVPKTATSMCCYYRCGIGRNKNLFLHPE